MNAERRFIHWTSDLRVAIVDWPAGYTNERHVHTAVEVVTVLEGSATLTEHPPGGDIRVHRLGKGDVHVIAEGDHHQVEAGDAGVRLLAVVAPNDKFEAG